MRVELDALSSERSRLALSRLREGHGLEVGAITLRLQNSHILSVHAFTQWSPDNIDEKLAGDELRAAEQFLSALMTQWAELRDAIGNRHAVIDLCYDYGMGAVRLGSLGRDGSFKRG